MKQTNKNKQIRMPNKLNSTDLSVLKMLAIKQWRRFFGHPACALRTLTLSGMQVSLFALQSIRKIFVTHILDTIGKHDFDE